MSLTNSHIKEHQKVRKFWKKHQKVRTRWFVYFCKWRHHTRWTNEGTSYWSFEWDITQHI